MSIKMTLAALAVAGGAAFAAAPASAAMPTGLGSAVQGAITSDVENVRIVCDVYGRCFRRPSYFGPRYYGGGYGYGRPRFYGGGGPRFYGGGYRRW